MDTKHPYAVALSTYLSHRQEDLGLHRCAFTLTTLGKGHQVLAFLISSCQGGYDIGSKVAFEGQLSAWRQRKFAKMVVRMRIDLPFQSVREVQDDHG